MPRLTVAALAALALFAPAAPAGAASAPDAGVPFEPAPQSQPLYGSAVCVPVAIASSCSSWRSSSIAGQSAASRTSFETAAA